MGNVIVYQNTKGLKTILKLLMIIVIFFWVIDLLMTFISTMAYFETNKISKLVDNLSYHSTTDGAASFFYLLFLIIFLRWIYLSYQNLNTFQIEGLEFTPKEAFVLFLIPILNLFKPFFILKELFLASNKNNYDNMAEKFINSRELETPNLITNFWFLMISNVIISSVLAFFSYFSELYTIIAFLIMLDSIIAVFSIILMNKIIRTVTLLQEDMLEIFK